MSVENRIVKVQKRNRALARFDASRICRAILRAGQSAGGFKRDFLEGTNDRLFTAAASDEAMAGFLADIVILVLNSQPHHLIANFPPRIEQIQDAVVHVLRSYGFQNTADAYACYRWGRHWLREGAITQDQFVGNGFSPARTLGEKTVRPHRSIPEINEMIRQGRFKTLLDESLPVYEASLDAAAKRILERVESRPGLRMIWVTGPSASGKTTTTVKLTKRLESAGLEFLMLNLDDYFWAVVEHPTDWINDRNYETPEALDIQLLNEHLRQLLEGQAIEKPVFDFKEGRRVGSQPVKLKPGQVLLLDCLHGLYPPLTEGIDPAVQFRLYLDSQPGTEPETNPHQPTLGPSDLRLLRRILRDARHRNYSPLRTILHWHYVRAGELFSILPLRGLADQVVHTAFDWELAVLKPFFDGTETHLPPPESLAPYHGFLDAVIRHRRIAGLLESVAGLSLREVQDYGLIPGDAVVREFIGGSTMTIPHNA